MATLELKQAMQHRLVTGKRKSWVGESLRTLRGALADVAQDLREEGVSIAAGDVDVIAEAVKHEIDTFGPLHVYLHDAEVGEIMVNGRHGVFVERAGVNEKTDLVLEDGDQLRAIVAHILALDSQKRLDSSVPFVDLAGPDGCRINMAIPPVVLGGPHITIRKFIGGIQTIDDLVALGMLDARMARFLTACVQSRVNILFAGSAGSGKTTLLQQLGAHIDPVERIVVIEDTPELRFVQPNVVRMLTRAANIEGRGELAIRDLFRNSLRMSPTRIILGEIRGTEALDYLQALSSGHRGSLAIVHAASPEEALARIENLARLTGIDIPPVTIRRQIALGLDVVVQVEHMADGSRKVTRISEVSSEASADGVDVTDIFRFEIGDVVDGEIQGEFVATRHIPELHDTFGEHGIEIDRGIYGL